LLRTEVTVQRLGAKAPLAARIRSRKAVSDRVSPAAGRGCHQERRPRPPDRDPWGWSRSWLDSDVSGASWPRGPAGPGPRSPASEQDRDPPTRSTPNATCNAWPRSWRGWG